MCHLLPNSIPLLGNKHRVFLISSNPKKKSFQSAEAQRRLARLEVVRVSEASRFVFRFSLSSFPPSVSFSLSADVTRKSEWESSTNFHWFLIFPRKRSLLPKLDYFPTPGGKTLLSARGSSLKQATFSATRPFFCHGTFVNLTMYFVIIFGFEACLIWTISPMHHPREVSVCQFHW